MFGGDEWLIIAIVALVLFGGSQLPKLARNLGEAQRELKKAMREGAAEDEDEAPPPPEVTAPAADTPPAASPAEPTPTEPAGSDTPSAPG